MAIQQMNLYEAWIREVKKAVFTFIIVFGALIVSVIYAVYKTV